MPVLPLIDLLLLSGWTALLVGFVLKVVYLTTTYRPTILSLAPGDFLEVSVAALLFAIALAARTWVKAQEPGPVAVRRRDETLAAWSKLNAGDNGSAQPLSSAALSSPGLSSPGLSSPGLSSTGGTPSPVSAMAKPFAQD